MWVGLILLAGLAPAIGSAVPARGTGIFGRDTLGWFNDLKWRNIGPSRGGRSLTAAGSTSRPAEYYFGATGGGVWKTVDGGLTWRPVTDGQLRSSSVGALAVCEANPDVVYVGMGETQLRGNIMQGDGVYRTVDGGRTWTHTGLTETQAISRIRIDPVDCDRVYVAALGHPYGPNPERGVYRSRDGGRTWKRVLFRNERTGAADLAMDPSHPQVLYAGLWQVYRKPWGLFSGGAGSGLFKTTDGGDTWIELTGHPGLPQRNIANVGIAVSPADPQRVYAIVEADDGGVFRSNDGGATWELATSNIELWERGYYYTRIYADPKDRETLYVVNIGLTRSRDGGKTFQRIRTPHSDHHDLWIAPEDPSRMILANDGGATVSINKGETWTSQAYPTAQMYHVITTRDRPYHVCGSQQDNTSICVSSLGEGGGLGPGPPQYAVGGGEAGYIATHPTNPNIFYSGHYDGFLTQFDRVTGETRNIQVWPEKTMGHVSSTLTERFQWTSPVLVAPGEPPVLYSASQHLWRSTDEGQSWLRISPDLTRNDSTRLAPASPEIRQDRTGADTYGTIFTVGVSTRDPRVIWTGSDDGLVHVTLDGGAHWTNVTPSALPEWSRLSLIEASPHDPAVAYLAANRYQLDDRAPYLFRTEDFGRSWTKIVDGIPEGHFARAIREDPVRRGLLYAGTEHGAYVSFDGGEHWRSLSLNLPDVEVADLVVEGHDLVIATHGRSFWILDDITPLRQPPEAEPLAQVRLFRPADPIRGLQPRVQVDYMLAQAAGRVQIDLLDSSGTLIRSFVGPVASGPERKLAPGSISRPPPVPSGGAGSHRFTWDLRYPGFTPIPGMVFWYVPTEGPVAPPGRYQVRLAADGVTRTQPFEVRADPRLPKTSQGDLEMRFTLGIQIRDQTRQAVALLRRVRELSSVVADRLARTRRRDPKALGARVRDQLRSIEAALYEVDAKTVEDLKNWPLKLINKLGYLLSVTESAEARPTDQTFVVFDRLSERLAAEQRRLDRMLRVELPKLNTELHRDGLPPVAP